MSEKNKSGKGKFFLGALLGAAAGAIAGKLISSKDDNEKSCECCDEKSTTNSNKSEKTNKGEKPSDKGKSDGKKS